MLSLSFIRCSMKTVCKAHSYVLAIEWWHYPLPRAITFCSSIWVLNSKNSFVSLKTVVLKVWTTWIRFLWGCLIKIWISHLCLSPVKSESQVKKCDNMHLSNSPQVSVNALNLENHCPRSQKCSPLQHSDLRNILSPFLFQPSKNWASKLMLNSNNYHILSNPTNSLIVSCMLLFYVSQRKMLPI